MRDLHVTGHLEMAELLLSHLISSNCLCTGYSVVSDCLFTVRCAFAGITFKYYCDYFILVLCTMHEQRSGSMTCTRTLGFGERLRKSMIDNRGILGNGVMLYGI